MTNFRRTLADHDFAEAGGGDSHVLYNRGAGDPINVEVWDSGHWRLVSATTGDCRHRGNGAYALQIALDRLVADELAKRYYARLGSS